VRYLLCLLFPLLASVAFAQQPERITVNLEKVPLREAVKKVFDGSDVKVQVDAKVPDVPVNLNIRDVSPTALIRILMRHAREQKGAEDLCLIRNNGVFYLVLDPAQRAQERAAEERHTDQAPPVPVPTAFRDPKLTRKVTLSVKNRPLREVVDTLFSGTGCQYTFTGNSDRITLSIELKDVTALDALRRVVEQAAKGRPQVDLLRVGEIYIIGPPERGRKDQP
jgi:hypothetical protein